MCYRSPARYITTRNLHWQWFNALIFGLVPKEAPREDSDSIFRRSFVCPHRCALASQMF